MRIAPTSVLSLSAVALAGCVANPFLAGYKGERMAPVTAAVAVEDVPAEGTAREIGMSDFTSTAKYADAGDEALAAAREVGADLVQWRVKQLSREEWVESDPVYQRRASGRGQFASYVPIPGTRERWRYSARFWRSVTVPSPVPGQPAPSSVPLGSSSPGDPRS